MNREGVIVCAADGTGDVNSGPAGGRDRCKYCGEANGHTAQCPVVS